ncbi:MAG: DUF2079 domain-containing protein [Gaiellaceae bacterium]
MSAGLSVERSRPRAAVLARARLWPLVVWTAMSGWSVALFAVVRNDYDDFRLGRFDLGNMTQAVWSTAQGRPLDITEGTGDQIVRLGAHVDPVLALLAPFWIVAPTPLTLAAVQIGATALGALPVFWLARRHLGSERAGAVAALAYLLYPWVAWTSLDAMHPVTFAIPLFLYAIWSLDDDRLWAFVVCAVLILATGELMGIPIAGLGVWYWLRQGRPRAGLAIVAGGVAWTSICLALIIPAARGDASPFYDRFASVGGSPGGLLRTAFTDPGAILSAISSGRDLGYLALLAVPTLGLFILSPLLAAIALPQLFVNTLSESPPTTDPRAHYIAAVVPFLIAASILGLARISAPVRRRATVPLLAAFAALTLYLGPWLPMLDTRSVGNHSAYPASHVRAMHDAAALIPPDVPVSATNRFGSRLSDRRYIYSVPVVQRAEWIVLDTWEPRLTRAGSTITHWEPVRFKAFWDTIDQSSAWAKVFDRDGVVVYRKR